MLAGVMLAAPLRFLPSSFHLPGAPAMNRLPSSLLPRLLLLAALLCGGARAQLVGTALGVSADTSGGLHLNAALSLRNLLIVGGYGVDARLLTDIGGAPRLELDGLVTLPIDTPLDNLSLYGGPGLALDFRPRLQLRPALTLGGVYTLDAQLGLFAEASWVISSGVRARAGVSYLF